MDKLINILPMSGLVLGVVFAFAFTKPNQQEPAFQLVNGVPTDVSSMNYSCDISETETCTYEDIALTIPKENGVFRLNP